ncbi:MAG: hypothetical protein QOJ89_3345 [bacterium]|jgi:hypothetical protein
MMSMRRHVQAMLLAALLATGAVAVDAATASAITVGQAVATDVPCNPHGNAGVWLQRGLGSGTSYTIPVDGTLTSFASRSYDPSSQGAVTQFGVFRQDPTTPANFLVVGLTDPVSLPVALPASPVTYPVTPFSVLAGDRVGLINLRGQQPTPCAGSTADAADTYSFRAYATSPTVGATLDDFNDFPGPLRVSVSAEVTPAAASPACDVALLAVGCWGFDEAPGSTTAVDASPSANDGTYLGLPVLGAPGVRNTSVTMDGVNDYVRVLDSASLDVGDTFTLEGWIKRSSTTKAQELFNKGNGGFQLTVMSAANGNEVWLRKAGVTTIARSTLPVPADGAFHHVVVTKNGTGAGSTHIYVDGVEGTNLLMPGQAILNTSSSMSFGGGASAPSNYDEFSIYDGVLTAAQVQARHSAGAPGI